MKELLLDILRQLLGLQKPRRGKIELTRRAVDEMYSNQLYPELIEDTFRYGTEVRKEVIVKKYQKYTAGIYYKYDDAEQVYRITFCFRN